MKKAINKTYLFLKAITVYLVIVIDRLTMSFFIGVDLPQFRKRDIIVSETTTDEQIGRSVDRQIEHDEMYKLEYLPRSKKRVTILICALFAGYLLSFIPWLVVLLSILIGVLSLIIGILWKQKLKK